MKKKHNILSIAIGLLFLILLQQLSVPKPIFRFLVPAFATFVLAVGLYNRWYLKEIQKYNFWTNLKQLLLLVAAFGVFLIIPSESLRSLFLLVSVAIIAFFEALLGHFAENLQISETLITSFGLFISIAGIALYIPPFSRTGITLLFILGIFASAVLTSRAFYEFTAKPVAVKWLSAVILGLFSTELFWAFSFLPFHFSVTAFLLLNFFYFCLILNYHFLYNSLTPKKIQFHLALMLITSAAVLLATPWKIIS